MKTRALAVCSSVRLKSICNRSIIFSGVGGARLNPRFRSAGATPTWVGMDVWGAAICYNVAEMQKHNLPRITSWQDLLKPEFKGKVVMPNPNSSGTGFLDVTAWLQIVITSYSIHYTKLYEVVEV